MQSSTPVHPERLLRLPDVLQRIPVSPAYWWVGVKEGRYPPGIKLSPRVTVWRESAIDSLVSRLLRG